MRRTSRRDFSGEGVGLVAGSERGTNEERTRSERGAMNDGRGTMSDERWGGVWVGGFHGVGGGGPITVEWWLLEPSCWGREIF